MIKTQNAQSISLVLILFVLTLSNSVFADDIENRVILGETFTWVTKEGAHDTLKRIKQAGFNVFIPAAWHGRGVSWRSNMSQKEPKWKNSSSTLTDPLAYLIKEAHKVGVEVHPWFTVVLRQRPLIKSHYDEGTPDRAFNIHIPEFRRYIVDLMLEVVKNYDVDGINLDFIRSMGICNSAFCIDDYRKKTGRDLLEDIANYRKNKKIWTSIALWNRQSITDIVRSFSLQSKKIKPDLIISVDTHPVAGYLVLQGVDSIEWANKGYIDVIYDMQYQLDIDEEKYYKALSMLNSKEKLALLVGNFERPVLKIGKVSSRNEKDIATVIEVSRRLGKLSKTLAMYDYSYMDDKQMIALGEVARKYKTLPVPSTGN